MEPPISKEDSYAERRQLFKNIWNATKNFEEKQYKVIKTVRLDSSSYRCTDAIKKYKFKALKSICTKLLHATPGRKDAAGVSNNIDKGSRKVRKRLRPSVRIKKHSKNLSVRNDVNFRNVTFTTNKNVINKSLPQNETEKNSHEPVLLSELLKKNRNYNTKLTSYNVETTRKIKSTIPKAKKKRRFIKKRRLRKKVHKNHCDLKISDTNPEKKPLDPISGGHTPGEENSSSFTVTKVNIT